MKTFDPSQLSRLDQAWAELDLLCDELPDSSERDTLLQAKRLVAGVESDLEARLEQARLEAQKEES